MAQISKLVRKGPHRYKEVMRLHGSKPTRFNSVDELKERVRDLLERFRAEDGAEARKVASLMNPKPIQTEQDYREAMAHLEEIFCVARKGTPEGEAFEMLSALISDWEKRS